MTVVALVCLLGSIAHQHAQASDLLDTLIPLASAPGFDGNLTALSETLGNFPISYDVSAVAFQSEDVAALFDSMEFEPVDWATTRSIWENSAISGQTLENLASSGPQFPGSTDWETYVEYYDGDDQFLVNLIDQGLDGTGLWEGTADGPRIENVQKTSRDNLGVRVTINLLQAAEAALEGECDAEAAELLLDAAWAAYHGVDNGRAPIGTAKSRAGNFGEEVESQVPFRAAKDAVAACDADSFDAALMDIIKEIEITYLRATYRYADRMDGNILNDNSVESYQINKAEGLVFMSVMEPYYAAASPDDVDTLLSIFDFGAIEDPESFIASYEPISLDVLSAVDGILAALNITQTEFGSLQEPRYSPSN